MNTTVMNTLRAASVAALLPLTSSPEIMRPATAMSVEVNQGSNTDQSRNLSAIATKAICDETLETFKDEGFGSLEDAGETYVRTGLGLGEVTASEDINHLIDRANEAGKAEGWNFETNIPYLKGEEKSEAEIATRSFFYMFDRIPSELLSFLPSKKFQFGFGEYDGSRSFMITTGEKADKTATMYLRGSSGSNYETMMYFVISDIVDGVLAEAPDCKPDAPTRREMVTAFTNLLTIQNTTYDTNSDPEWYKNYSPAEGYTYLQAVAAGDMTPEDAIRHQDLYAGTFNLELDQAHPYLAELRRAMNQARPELGDQTFNYLAGLLGDMAERSAGFYGTKWIELDAQSLLLERYIDRESVIFPGTQEAQKDERDTSSVNEDEVADGLIIENDGELSNRFPSLDVVLHGLDDTRRVRLYFDTDNQRVLTELNRSLGYVNDNMPNQNLLKYDNRGLNSFLESLSYIFDNTGVKLEDLQRGFIPEPGYEELAGVNGNHIVSVSARKWQGWDAIAQLKQSWDK